jgi:ribonuclease E
MTKRMLVDATHPEETRVVVVSGNRLEELDFEIASRRQLKGNIYLARVTRVEPSLQAAFVEYGGNRHGFLAFSEIHPDYYRIPVADREALIAEEERLQAAEERRLDEAVETPANRSAQRVAPDSEVPDESPEDESADDETANGTANDTAVRAGANGDDEGDEPATSGMAGVETARTEMAEAIPVAMVSEETPAEGEMAESEMAEGEMAESEMAESEMAGRGGAEVAVVENVDVIGGDEVEDAQRRRPRPLRSYKIQEVTKRRQVMLVQVTKEERGNKGAALTTYLSLPGRYCVLMPNTGRGGGISRKITNPADRKRLKEILADLDIPEGMAVILRTAGLERSKQEIKRDLEYLLRLWDDIRDQTLKSTAPCLIYEEANLIKRAIRDLYTDDLGEVWVDGENGYNTAKDFMRMLMPSHAKRVQLYHDEAIPLFHRYQVETQIDAIHSPVVQLRSGGYIVINPTEALVAIDVNSGKSTRERNIEETAWKTNLEAAEEIARQLRLRDLAGLIVIDFIDMEDSRNVASVERRLKESMKTDRARIQLGRISLFGLLELSRQRLRPSLVETNFERCPHCTGAGVIRSVESSALHALRAIEEEGIRKRSSEITVHVPTRVALYILNQKRSELAHIEERYGFHVALLNDDTLLVPDLRLERVRAKLPGDDGPLVSAERIYAETDRVLALEAEKHEDDEVEVETGTEVEAEGTGESEAATAGAAERTGDTAENGDGGESGSDNGRRRRRRRRRGRPGEGRDGAEARPGVAGAAADGEDSAAAESGEEPAEGGEAGADAQAEGGGSDAEADADAQAEANGETEAQRRKRRRGKRGGRRRSRPAEGASAEGMADEGMADEGTPDEGTPDEDAADNGQPLLDAPLFDGEVDDEPFVETSATPTPRYPAPVPAPSLMPEDFDLILSGDEPPVEAAPPAEEPAPVAEGEAPKKRTLRKRKAPEADAAQADAAQAEAAQAEAIPVQATPAGETSGKPKRVPARKRKTPEAEAPAPEAVAAKAPAASPPAEDAPAGEAPAKPKRATTRKRKAPEAEAPAAEAPVAEAPVVEVPVVEVPVVEAPAQEPAPEAAAPEPAPPPPPAEPPAPARRGWWNR